MYFLFLWICLFSVQFSHSFVSDSLWPHGLQHARPSCSSPTPGVYSNSSPLSPSNYLIICRPLLLLPSTFPSIRVFSNKSALNTLIQWVAKILWRRKWQPTPVFLLGNPSDREAWLATVHGVAKSWTRLNDWTDLIHVNKIKIISNGLKCTHLPVNGIFYIF